jgi:small subunit ribosomal protein S4
LSTYGMALADKQKIKYHYGMREAQLRRYFAKARSQKGNTGEILLVMCERRLDNVVRRAGFTTTRMQARQGVVHRHFQLNGKTINKPSIAVQPGDVITLRNRPNVRKLYREIVDSGSRQNVDWISFDAKDLEARVQALPTGSDATVPNIEIGRVIAFMAR